MKTKIIFLLFYILVNFSVKAQNYVTIPDANFAAWLQENYPNCMNGNQMNIDCAEIQNEVAVFVNSLSISDLTGIEYFTSLDTLECKFNNITFLSNLPHSLKWLTCYQNQISNIDYLPNSLIYFQCGRNLLTSIPTLPPNLKNFSCAHNLLTELPLFPQTLRLLTCESNQLSFLPQLPIGMGYISCNRNQLTNLPQLPPNLEYFDCGFNDISCFPIFPNSFEFDYFHPSFYIGNNPFSCLPNYITAMDSLSLTYPLCLENNEAGCLPVNGVFGTTFLDNDNNCTLELTERLTNNIPVNLYDNFDSLLIKSYTLSSGNFQFNIGNGAYRVKIDSLDLMNFPFALNCELSEFFVTTDSIQQVVDSIYFPLSCKPGFDIGTQSVLTNGWVFPGQNHDLKIIAGDLSQWYNMNCAAGISGEVQISVSGPVAFQIPSNEALSPTVLGNSFTYAISDFGNVDIETAFGLIFKTDTTAQAGDQICVSINVTPTNGDNNMSNNLFEYCYQVVNSYDPNMKEVYPVNVEPGYEDYFTYTIHFQNTGSAPAFNIRLLDTLDENLDLETFQVINYSHYNSTMLKNNILTFHFPNIMLADSTSDLEGSKGFVQYRIKPKANLALGTQIKNTAYIYFDFNAPIVTNTTINEYVETVSISEKENSNIFVFPNPFSTSATIVFKTSLIDADIKLYNVYGQEVQSITDFSGDKLKIERENLANGVYYLKVDSQNEASETVKLILKN